MALTMEVTTEVLRLAEPFRIAGHVFDDAPVVVVTLSDGEWRGHGEASGVYYTGDDTDHMLGELEGARAAIEVGPSRDELRAILPPGGARNAVDAAMWELEAARADTTVWRLAGLDEPKPALTTFTLGADEPAAMGRKAAAYDHARSIKVKLTGDLDLDGARLRAIRATRPDVWLGVDGNQGYRRKSLERLVDLLQEVDVSLLEQPLARGSEAELDGFASPIPLAGDESLLCLDDLAAAPGRFDVVNIKLDKCGGLTEGLLMATEARRLGLGVMVGTMVGTSLATAPGFVLGQLADLVDLDGPTFLVEDRKPSVDYEDGTVFASDRVWGSREALSA